MASENESLKVGDKMQVSNCAITDIRYEDDDMVVKFDSSPYEYCLPASALTRIPPAQAEPVKEWVPEHMEEVWVKAKVTSVVDGMAELDFEGADDYIVVPISQLRQLPVTQEEGVK